MDNISAGGTVVRSELRVSCCPAGLGLPRAWTVLLVRVGLYFLMIPFKQCFITISRAFLRVYTRFLSYVLSGSREWEKFFIVLNFLF
jgi:hypothetical protein